jgi:hypothetical protein
MRPHEDEAWVLAKEAGVAPPTIDAARAAQYELLKTLLAEEEKAEPPKGWEARLMTALPADALPKSRRLRGSGLVAVAAVGLAAAVVLMVNRQRSDDAFEPRLTLGVLRGEDPHRGPTAAVGDSLELKLEVGAQGELRLYRTSGELVARCPGDQRCRESSVDHHRILTLVFQLTEPETYRAVGLSQALGPSSAGLDADLSASTRKGLTVTTLPPIEVR